MASRISRPAVLASSSRSHLYSASGFVSPKGGSWTARRRWIRCGLCAQNWWDSQSWTGLSGAAGGGAFAGDSAADESSTRTTAARYRPYWPSYRSSVFSPPWGRGSVSVPALPRPEFYPAQIRKLLVLLVLVMVGWTGKRLRSSCLLGTCI